MSYKFFLPNPSYNHDGVSFAIKLWQALWKDQGVRFYEYTEINDYETCNGSNTPKCLTLTEYGEGGVLSSHKDLYTERFSGFMRNGGVTALQRHGLRPDGTYGTVDNLSITYDGNRVQSVSDAAPAITQPGSMDYPGGSSGNVFSYNSWGALEKDTGRGITSVTYDNLGNPQQISYSDQSYTRHVYSSGGDKLKSVHHSTPSLLSLAAMDGTATKAVSAAAGQETFEYRGQVIYRNGAVHMVLFPGGYATISGSTVTFHYYTQDYLGNNRAVVNGSTGAIEQTTAYYPYGGVIADLGSGNSGQPFKFGGKELVTANGLNEYDFGARRYFQAIPHFTSIDPLCEKYYWLSPYLYCANDPVNAIDPSGRIIEMPKNSSTEQILMVMWNMQQVTNDKLAFKTQKDGTVRIRIASLGNGNKAKGTLLIRRLNSSKKTMTITITSGGNQEIGESKLDATNGKGTNTKVLFNHNSNPNINIIDKTTGRAIISKRPSYIGLVHEMIHADRDMRGIAFDMSEKEGHKYINQFGQESVERLPKEEAATIGYNHVSNIDVTENDIREELGLPLRGTYGAYKNK